MNRQDLLTEFELSMLLIGKEMHGEQGLFSGFSPAQGHVLMIIGTQGPMRIKQLAEVLCVTSGAITQHIDVLEKAGLLVRTINPDNRREIMVEITPDGSATYVAMRRAKFQMLIELFSDLSDRELQTLVELVKKVSHKYIAPKGGRHEKI